MRFSDLPSINISLEFISWTMSKKKRVLKISGAARRFEKNYLELCMFFRAGGAQGGSGRLAGSSAVFSDLTLPVFCRFPNDLLCILNLFVNFPLRKMHK